MSAAYVMHPLRFPNSGIRAKVFVGKIGFKLCVMRLNRVELFYTLVEAISSESRRCLQGWGSHMQGAVARNGSSPPGVTTHGHDRLWSPAASTQGLAGSDQTTRGCRPRPTLPPVGVTALVAGVATPWQGGCRPQRATAACTGATTAEAQ
ncbi:hypothetical protein GW17_00056110 [Ensete ventricosum]|nr:hypothetical protein GW17_00056110 [Ensete ventricosum]